MVGGPEIVMVQQVVTGTPAASTTLTQMEPLKAPVGVPESTPVALLNVIPAGRALKVE
jgi:phosphoribosylcarboxyaminoimidazole (NCAIR) mutase